MSLTLAGQRGVEGGEPAVEAGGAVRGVGPDVLELGADAGQLRGDRGELAVADLEPPAHLRVRLALAVTRSEGLRGRGAFAVALGTRLRERLVRAGAHGGGVGRGALAGEPDLLGGLLTGRGGVGLGQTRVLARGCRLRCGALERLLGRLQPLRDRVGAGALVAEAGERDLARGVQELRAARPPLLLAELSAQLLDARERARVGLGETAAAGGSATAGAAGRRARRPRRRARPAPRRPREWRTAQVRRPAAAPPRPAATAAPPAAAPARRSAVRAPRRP